jgi:phospholipid/cholesterol/gamma-HCH transport system substrate-binding protein
MRTLTEFNRVRVGLMGAIVVLLITGVAQSFTSVPMLFAQPNYYAQFKDAAGIKVGDKVKIAGVNVGLVRSLTIHGDKVVVGFSLGSQHVGTESRAAIRTDTVLGRKTVEIEPRGPKMLHANGILPVGQTTTPYQIYDAFFDATKAAQGWDVDTVKRSLNVLSETIDQTHPHLDAALEGIKRFSDTIGKRSQQFKQLLANANSIAAIIGNRSVQIDQLLVDAQSLLHAIDERGQAIAYLLERLDAASQQLQGFINDNPDLNRTLEQLRVVTDMLVQRKEDIADTLVQINKFVASIAEGAASGPFFKAIAINLLPPVILQPWLDAAFQKRGIDPEDFWRSAGLPAFRFPDPNGTRFPNGAPPSAPPALEGTPDHPGPAVAPGSPCSYTPPPELLPRPGDPMPCAGVDQAQGPFGTMPDALAPPDVVPSPPNPNGLPPTPGIPVAGRPGQPAPDVPGTPVPLPPNAPPGARREGLQPAGPTPPPSTFAPGLPPGPAAPPGPGPQVPQLPGPTGG